MLKVFSLALMMQTVQKTAHAASKEEQRRNFCRWRQPLCNLGFDIDYKCLLKEFQSWGTLVRAFCYTAVIEDQEYTSIRPLLDWLDYNGFTVVTKPAKEFSDGEGRRKIKRNMGVELAVDPISR